MFRAKKGLAHRSCATNMWARSSGELAHVIRHQSLHFAKRWPQIVQTNSWRLSWELSLSEFLLAPCAVFPPLASPDLGSPAVGCELERGLSQDLYESPKLGARNLASSGTMTWQCGGVSRASFDNGADTRERLKPGSLNDMWESKLQEELREAAHWEWWMREFQREAPFFRNSWRGMRTLGHGDHLWQSSCRPFAARPC